MSGKSCSRFMLFDSDIRVNTDWSLVIVISQLPSLSIFFFYMLGFDCLNSEGYQANLLPFLDDWPDTKFAQNTTPVHKSRSTTQWLADQGVALFVHLPRSPNLNGIENVSGLLARHVYGNNRQYDTVQQLRHSVENEWNRLILKACIIECSMSFVVMVGILIIDFCCLCWWKIENEKNWHLLEWL